MTAYQSDTVTPEILRLLRSTPGASLVGRVTSVSGSWDVYVEVVPSGSEPEDDGCIITAGSWPAQPVPVTSDYVRETLTVAKEMPEYGHLAASQLLEQLATELTAIAEAAMARHRRGSQYLVAQLAADSAAFAQYVV
jgi:hypothetical protein